MCVSTSISANIYIYIRAARATSVTQMCVYATPREEREHEHKKYEASWCNYKTYIYIFIYTHRTSYIRIEFWLKFYANRQHHAQYIMAPLMVMCGAVCGHRVVASWHNYYQLLYI